MILTMDREFSNDDLETWQDFFGGPVELGSSLLRLYDSCSGYRKPFKNLNVLSPNVQRMLAHSKYDTEIDTYAPQSTCSHSQLVTRYALNTKKTRGHKNFPLSAVACKISQSSVDLQLQTDSEVMENLQNNKAAKQLSRTHCCNVKDKINHNTGLVTGESNISDNNSSINESMEYIETGKSCFVRPLSTSSTDSSSSSASLCSTNYNQAGSEYLASIESLADHSDVDQIYENRSTLSIGERVCLEVIHTEENYIGDLKQVIEGYLESWREQSQLEDKQLEILFCNIQEIYDFNSRLLQKLKVTENDPIEIAKCFIDCGSGFNVYTKYCTNYPHAISLLTELLQSASTSNLLRQTQSMLGHKLPLGSYLLKPVQRIMKYHLLLRNLYKQHENVCIENASQLMTNVAEHIDQVKKRIEQQSRVQELEGSLDGWLGPSLTVLGELCLEGTLQERNHKPRHVFLFDKMLLITKRKEDGRLAYKSHIMCSNLMLVESIPGEPTCFHVIPYDNPKNQSTLQARSIQQKKQWGLQLKRLMLEQFQSEIPTRAKALVLGINPDEDIELHSKRDSPKRNHSTPEYLERRHQRRRTELSMRRLNKNRKLKFISNNFNDSNESNVNSEMKTYVAEEKRYSSWYLDDDHSNDVEYSYQQKSYSNDNITIQDSKIDKEQLDNKACKSLETWRCKSEPGLPNEFGTSNKNTESDNVDCLSSPDPVKTENTLKYLKPPIRSFEIKQYNTKTLPKKITKIKRNRSKTIKTDNSNSKSKFYTELSDASETVLHIYESKDSKERTDSKSNLNSVGMNSSDNSVITSNVCSNSLKNFKHTVNDELLLNKTKVQDQSDDEHIYETLRESTDTSQVNYLTNVDPDRSLLSSPENDYVILDEIKGHGMEEKREIIDQAIEQMKKVQLELQSLHLENSPNISPCISSEDVLPHHEMLTRNNSNSFIQRFRTFIDESQPRKSITETGLRKEETNSELPIYKQGSKNLGCRIANSDYADPKILFKDNITKQISGQLINNSVLDTNNKKINSNGNKNKITSQIQCAINIQSNEVGFYEKSVEDSLEIDFFRDSAIYSDDNRYESINIDMNLMSVPGNESDQDEFSKVSDSQTKQPVNEKNETNVVADNDRVQPDIVPRNNFSDGWVKEVIGKFQ